jgi:hypothetical protein
MKEEDEVENNYEFMCEKCGKSYNTQRGLNKHQKMAHKELTYGEKKNVAVAEKEVYVAEVPSLDEEIKQFFVGRDRNSISLSQEDKRFLLESFSKKFKHIINVGCNTQCRLAYQKLWDIVF